jgi:hypothetical protein
MRDTVFTTQDRHGGELGAIGKSAVMVHMTHAAHTLLILILHT